MLYCTVTLPMIFTSAAVDLLVSTMAPWHDFDSIFYFNKGFTYDGKVIEQIVSNRRSLENQLFVDRLLALIGVKAGRNSPLPNSTAPSNQFMNSCKCVSTTV